MDVFIRNLTRFIGLYLVLGAIISVNLVTQVYADQRFRDNRNGTVTDLNTGMTWIQDPSSIPSLKGGMLWTQAMKACQELAYGGKSPGNWRLPSIEQLEGIVSESRGSPRISSAFKAHNAPYWSRTSYIGKGAKAWTVNFKNGFLGSYPKFNLIKSSKLYARCVDAS